MKCPYCGKEGYTRYIEIGEINGDDNNEFGTVGEIEIEFCDFCECEKGVE